MGKAGEGEENYAAKELDITVIKGFIRGYFRLIILHTKSLTVWGRR